MYPLQIFTRLKTIGTEVGTIVGITHDKRAVGLNLKS